MSHLALDELLDLADGTQVPSETARLHLASCAACRDRLADAAQTLSAIVDPIGRDVPEPSPLFWEHLSARVHEAVAIEAAAPGPSGRAGRWLSWRFVVPAAACLVAVMALTMTLRTPATPSQSADATSTSATADNPDGTVDDTAAWSMIADLAAELDWDSAVDAGLTPLGGVDRALFDLTTDERRELQRLINEDLTSEKLSHSGV